MVDRRAEQNAHLCHDCFRLVRHCLLRTSTCGAARRQNGAVEGASAAVQSPPRLSLSRWLRPAACGACAGVVRQPRRLVRRLEPIAVRRAPPPPARRAQSDTRARRTTLRLGRASRSAARRAFSTAGSSFTGGHTVAGPVRTGGIQPAAGGPGRRGTPPMGTTDARLSAARRHRARLHHGRACTFSTIRRTTGSCPGRS